MALFGENARGSRRNLYTRLDRLGTENPQKHKNRQNRHKRTFAVFLAICLYEPIAEPIAETGDRSALSSRGRSFLAIGTGTGN